MTVWAPVLKLGGIHKHYRRFHRVKRCPKYMREIRELVNQKLADYEREKLTESEITLMLMSLKFRVSKNAYESSFPNGLSYRNDGTGIEWRYEQ